MPRIGVCQRQGRRRERVLLGVSDEVRTDSCASCASCVSWRAALLPNKGRGDRFTIWTAIGRGVGGDRQRAVACRVSCDGRASSLSQRVRLCRLIERERRMTCVRCVRRHGARLREVPAQCVLRSMSVHKVIKYQYRRGASQNDTLLMPRSRCEDQNASVVT